MSLHRTDYLVSIHQDELARHAADIRLAQTASGAGATGRRGVGLGKALAGLLAAMRPVRSPIAPSFKTPGQAAIKATQVSRPVVTPGSSS